MGMCLVHAGSAGVARGYSHRKSGGCCGRRRWVVSKHVRVHTCMRECMHLQL